MAALAALVAAALPAATSGAAGRRVRPLARAASSTQWTTAAFNNQRTGENPDEKVLSIATVKRLKLEWVSGSGEWLQTPPVEATDVTVGSKVESLIYAGSSFGTVYAFNAATGKTVWTHRLASHLGGRQNPDCDTEQWGVTDSPVIDRSTNRLYVVDDDEHLYALSLSTGKTVAGWPVPLGGNTAVEFTWAGLTESHGIVYVAIASKCDDGVYFGRLVAVSTTSARITGVFSAVTPASEPGGGAGIWGWGGASVDLSGKHLYVATGNTQGANSNAGYGDSVLELDAGSLKVVGANNPDVPQGDNDMGSSPVLFRAPGCPAQLAVENKLGWLYVYDQGDVSAGPVQALEMNGEHYFIGDAAWSARTDRLYVNVTVAFGDYPPGLTALKPVRHGGTCTFETAWSDAFGPNYSIGSPATIANGVVYFGDGNGHTLYALNGWTGAVLWHDRLPGTVHVTPIVVNGHLYASDWDGDVFGFGLAPRG